MAKKDKGFILLHRSLLDNREIWDTGETFTKGQAWVDLLLLTQHSEYKGVQRGQLKTSKCWLAKRWGWSRNRVVRYLDTLTEQGMVIANGTPYGTTITIVNYEKFQNVRSTDGTSDGTPKRTTKRTTNGAQTNNVYTNNDSTKNVDTRSELEKDPEYQRIKDKWGPFE